MQAAVLIPAAKRTCREALTCDARRQLPQLPVYQVERQEAGCQMGKLWREEEGAASG